MLQGSALRMGALVGVPLVAVIVAIIMWLNAGPEGGNVETQTLPAPDEETNVAETPTPDAAPAEPEETASNDGESDTAPEPVSPPVLAAPTFDVVRVAPDGSALIAGKAAPNAKVDQALLKGLPNVNQVLWEGNHWHIGFSH